MSASEETQEHAGAIWDPKNPRMHIGTQRFSTSDEHLAFLARCGVSHMAMNNAKEITPDPSKGWTVEELVAKKEKAAKHGITVEMAALPVQSLNVNGGSVPEFMRGNFKDGEKEVEVACQMVKAASEAGIPALKYFLCEMENQRTDPVPVGRGGVRYSTWDLSKADAETPRYDEPVTAEQNWERITFFLERVIPVATKYKVRMACHPCDPWLPLGYKNVDRVLGGYDGFKSFIDICPSPYHGLNLCLGCMAESVVDPRNEVADIIRYFGERKKIHLIHFRNIVGSRNKFQEVYPDEGEMNMFVLMRALKEVGYPHMVVPDHAPKHDAPGHFEQAFSFQFGFIKALLQAIEIED